MIKKEDKFPNAEKEPTIKDQVPEKKVSPLSEAIQRKKNKFLEKARRVRARGKRFYKKNQKT